MASCTACTRLSGVRVASSTPLVPGILFYAHQLQAKVANSAEDTVQVGLIADLADEDGAFVARFQGQPLESGLEMFGQAAPDSDPVPFRLHMPSGALRV
jgi:hypothetical protein